VITNQRRYLSKVSTRASSLPTTTALQTSSIHRLVSAGAVQPGDRAVQQIKSSSIGKEGFQPGKAMNDRVVRRWFTELQQRVPVK
jgi:hypothetical protein